MQLIYEYETNFTRMITTFTYLRNFSIFFLNYLNSYSNLYTNINLNYITIDTTAYSGIQNGARHRARRIDSIIDFL